VLYWEFYSFLNYRKGEFNDSIISRGKKPRTQDSNTLQAILNLKGLVKLNDKIEDFLIDDEF